MKRFFYDFLVLGISLCCQPFTQASAQLPQPSEWVQFVNGSQNKLQMDTFRLQTFNHSSKDNWDYVLAGDVKEHLFTKAETSLEEDSKGLQLNFTGSVEFAPYNLKHYKDVKISLLYGGNSLKEGNRLSMLIFREGEMQNSVLNNAHEQNRKYALQPLGRNPSYIKLFTEGENKAEGYYGLLEIFVTGHIPYCSYFTGTGCWNDTVRWSHLPAARHRTALIEGDVEIKENIACDYVHLSNSSLEIDKDVSLGVRRLELYDTQTTVSGDGDLAIEDELTLHYTFPQKGKWYFMSFPCDIYVDEMSSGFLLGDDSPNEGGNYIYVRTYDGVRRAEQNVSSGNWKVRPASSKHTLLFERGKGYLVALDQLATQQEISFSSKDKKRNNALSKSVTESVDFPIVWNSLNADNYGWQLFGNPFLCPLHFSDIRISGFENYVYIFENGGYQRYALTEDRNIPPYTPFFLKAVRKDVSVTFNRTANASHSAVNVPCSKSYNGSLEPSVTFETTSNSRLEQSVLLKLAGDRCCIDCPATGGLCRIFNLNGCLLRQYSLQAGHNEFIWNAPSGCYLFDIETDCSEHLMRKIVKR